MRPIKNKLTRLLRLDRGCCRQGQQRNFRVFPGGNGQSREIFRLIMFGFVLSVSGLLGSNGFAAPAELPQQKTTVYSQIGLAVPAVGDMGDIADTGIFFGAQMMQQVDPTASYGVGVSYYSFGKASEDQVDTSVSVLSTLLMTHHNLGAGGNASPILKTGLGFARTQVNINSATTSGPAVQQGTNEEDISPTLLLGLGFDMKVSQGAMFGMSVDYQHFFFRVGDVNGGGSFNVVAHLRM